MSDLKIDSLLPSKENIAFPFLFTQYKFGDFQVELLSHESDLSFCIHDPTDQADEVNHLILELHKGKSDWVIKDCVGFHCNRIFEAVREVAKANELCRSLKLSAEDLDMKGTDAFPDVKTSLVIERLLLRLPTLLHKRAAVPGFKFREKFRNYIVVVVDGLEDDEPHLTLSRRSSKEPWQIDTCIMSSRDILRFLRAIIASQ